MIDNGPTSHHSAIDKNDNWMQEQWSGGHIVDDVSISATVQMLSNMFCFAT